MDSPQSVVSPLKNSLPESERHQANLHAEKPSMLSREIDLQRKETAVGDLEDFMGALEVCIHQARDIHNICIYQKQDVYAKLSLTSDPDKTVSTKIINGGGANPVFNENLSLNVGEVDSSLRCEIWMLSRVKNYLEDQLLGFTLVPVSEILLHNGKLEKEFSLSSTDLFHSPAGFVQLSVSFIGVPPEVIPIPPPPTSSINSVPEEMDKIEFPDPKVVNENNQMVEEYFGMPCSNVESQCSDSLITSETENQAASEVEARLVENLSMGTGSSKPSANGVSSASEEHVSPAHLKSREEEANDSKCSSAEAKVVQQEIVDMYMKSMQQFTESLAKMKLPMELENGGSSSENSTSCEQKTAESKSSGSRVFYGSRAFF